MLHLHAFCFALAFFFECHSYMVQQYSEILIFLLNLTDNWVIIGGKKSLPVSHLSSSSSQLEVQHQLAIQQCLAYQRVKDGWWIKSRWLSCLPTQQLTILRLNDNCTNHDYHTVACATRSWGKCFLFEQACLFVSKTSKSHTSSLKKS